MAMITKIKSTRSHQVSFSSSPTGIVSSCHRPVTLFCNRFVICFCLAVRDPLCVAYEKKASMGITSSSATASTEDSPLRRDLKYLGDRMPFGDGDLYHVYQIYQHFHEKQNNNLSFVSQVGVSSRRLWAEQQQQRNPGKSTSVSSLEGNLNEYQMLLQAMEKRILPTGFGLSLIHI